MLRSSWCWRFSLISCEPFTCCTWSLWAHQQSDQCRTWLSSEAFYGKEFPGKVFCFCGYHEAEYVLSRDGGDSYSGNQKYSCWTADFTPWDFIHAVNSAQGPEAVPIQRVKVLLGWPGTVTSAPENAHKEGCLRVKVSAKVRTVWRRFQLQDLIWVLLHLIMQCPVAAISLSKRYHYCTKNL